MASLFFFQMKEALLFVGHMSHRQVFVMDNECKKNRALKPVAGVDMSSVCDLDNKIIFFCGYN